MTNKTLRNIYVSILLVAICTAWIAAIGGYFSFDRLRAILQTHPFAAPFLFVLAHVFAAIALLPCSPFTLIAGFLWPIYIALPLSIGSALLASSMTFFVGRYCQPEKLVRLTGTNVGRYFDEVSVTRSWRLVVLVYMNPMLPSSTLGYVFGLSKLPPTTFVWSAFLSMLPLQIIFVALGGSLRQAFVVKVWTAAISLLTIAVSAYIGWHLIKRKVSIDRGKEKPNA